MAASNEISIVLSLQSAQALAQLTGFLQGAGQKLLAFAGTAASLHAVMHIEELTEAFALMGERIGENIQIVTGLTYAADKFNISNEAITKGMKTLSVEMVKNGEADKSVLDKMFELADRFQNTEGSARRAALAVQYFGKQGIELIPILAQCSAGLREMIDRGEMLRNMNEASVISARAATEAWKDFKIILESLAQAIAANVLPAVTRFLENFNTGLLKLRENIEAFNRWAKGMGGAEGLFAGSGAKKNLLSNEEIAGLSSSEADAMTQDQFNSEKARLELAIKQNQVFEQAARNDFTQTADVRLKSINGTIENQIKLLDKLKDLYGKAEADGLIPKSEREAQDVSAQGKQVSLRKNLEPTSIGGNVIQAMDKQIQSWGTIAQQVGQVFTSTIGTAISSISSGITGLIQGTKTWGQALTQVYNQIATQFVSMIVEMAVKWVFQHTVMAAVSEAFRIGETASTAAHTGTQVAIHSGGEAAKTGATGTGVFSRGALRLFETVFHGIQVAAKVAAHIAGEIMMTIVSVAQSAIRVGVIIAEAIKWLFQAAFKGASAVADIPYVGPILAIAAIGAIIAAGVGAMGGFEHGGYTGDGPSGEPAGTAHKGEYYFTAPTTRRLGVANLDRIARGLPVNPDMSVRSPGALAIQSSPADSGVGSAGAQQAGATPINISVHNWNDEAAMRKHIKDDPETHHVLLDKMRREGHVIGARA